MKKRAILILSAMMATGMLFTGCSSSGNNQKTEKSEEETKYADEQFIYFGDRIQPVDID